MIKLLTLFSPVRAAAYVGQTAASSIILPKRTGITNAQFEGEIEESEASEPAFGQIEIPNFSMKTYTDISDQLLEDSVQNVEALLSEAFSEDFGRKEGMVFVNGTGVKQPRGIIRDIYDTHDVREIAFDVAYAQGVMAPLVETGFPVMTMRQGWVTQSPALNELERAIVGRKFQHGGHPVLRWCFSNIAIHTDSAGNRVMHKGKSTDRIDGAVATWMALSRCATGEDQRSFYSQDIKPEDLAWN
jgi:hypothetical protein